MRRCPECYEIYEEGERFCEVDGQRLLADPALSSASEETSAPSPSGDRSVQPAWLTGLVGVAVGVLLCAAVYIVYAMWTASSDADDQGSSYSARTREPVPSSVPPAPARLPDSTETPAEDESADSEAEASPEASPEPAPAPENQTVAARLNQGPVSTGPKVKDGEKTAARIQTIILMQDGTSVEVDAAWQDKQGIWYRRGGLVSFLESGRVKAILARSESKPSPASSK